MACPSDRDGNRNLKKLCYSGGQTGDENISCVAFQFAIDDGTKRSFLFEQEQSRTESS